MAKYKFGSRDARKKLDPRGRPYFEPLEKNLRFGYRKGKLGGAWGHAAAIVVGARRYRDETIGDADDFAEADGVKVLTYHQARDRARERVKALAEDTRIASLGPALTVRSALDEYLVTRDAREHQYRVGRIGNSDSASSKGLQRDARSRLKHVDETLAAKSLAALTTDDLTAWRKGLLQGVAAQLSAQRVVNDFKAALNDAARSYKAKLPPDFRDTIRDGLASMKPAGAVAREAQVLPDADVRRIISAAWEIDAEGGWEGDLGRILLVLAAAGARFSQVMRMTVADVQVAQKRLIVPVSRKGRGYVRQVSHIGVRVGDDVMAALTGGDRRPPWSRGSAASPALATRRRWALGKERAPPLVRRARTDVRVGCDSLSSRLGAWNGTLQPQAFEHRAGTSRQPADANGRQVA